MLCILTRIDISIASLWCLTMVIKTTSSTSCCIASVRACAAFTAWTKESEHPLKPLSKSVVHKAIYHWIVHRIRHRQPVDCKVYFLDIFRHIDCWVNVAPNEVGMVRKPTNTKDHNHHHHHFHDPSLRFYSFFLCRCSFADCTLAP